MEERIWFKLTTDTGNITIVGQDDAPEIVKAYEEWMRSGPSTHAEKNAWDEVCEAGTDYLIANATPYRGEGVVIHHAPGCHNHPDDHGDTFGECDCSPSFVIEVEPLTAEEMAMIDDEARSRFYAGGPAWETRSVGIEGADD